MQAENIVSKSFVMSFFTHSSMGRSSWCCSVDSSSFYLVGYCYNHLAYLVTLRFFFRCSLLIVDITFDNLRFCHLSFLLINLFNMLVLLLLLSFGACLCYIIVAVGIIASIRSLSFASVSLDWCLARFFIDFFAGCLAVDAFAFLNFMSEVALH